MPDFIYYLIAGAALTVIIILANLYIKWKAYGQEESKRRKLEEKRKNAASQGLLVNCPVCESPLLPGENLFSTVFGRIRDSDQLCTIKGCPHCYPDIERGVRRVCPVCHKEVPLGDGHLVARLFNKTASGKKHVIVTGCSQCCRGVR